MPTETATKASGLTGKQMDKAYMCMQMARSTLASSTRTTRTAMDGKNGEMELYFKVNFRMERNTVRASSGGLMGAVTMENSTIIKFAGTVFTLGRTRGHITEAG